MNTDKAHLDELKSFYNNLDCLLAPIGYSYGYPLDTEIRDEITKIALQDTDDEFKIFTYLENVKNLWSMLIKKSIICLRYFDDREPFMKIEGKEPYAYGMKELTDFFNQYTDFEDVLYGGAKYYRDHVMHVFRVWLLGMVVLLRDNCQYLKSVKVSDYAEVNNYEKLSIWTIIALTHDLGYPLEKSAQIIEKTKDMMKAFVSNPAILMDFSFSGVQNSMNDFVLRFISSKMWEIDPENRKTLENTKEHVEEDKKKQAQLQGDDLKNYIEQKRYVARLQPKYYFKFQKALEHSEHGVLSSLILYKILLYFLESDYSLNEDYMFDYEDSRQFYIRREILRSIASHTCKDIYQNDALRFSFLLILCDDAQEWGRKNISQLYVNNAQDYEFKEVTLNMSDFLKDTKTYAIFTRIADSCSCNQTDKLKLLLKKYIWQCKAYRSLFRDGQDTSSRNFVFFRNLSLKTDGMGGGQKEYLLSLEVSTDRRTRVLVKMTNDDDISADDSVDIALAEIMKLERCRRIDGNKKLEILIG